MSVEAIRTWQEKLDYYLAEEAKCSDPEQKFKLHKGIQEARAKLAELTSRATHEPTSPAVHVSLGKLPQSGPNFLGREAELKLLDDAWSDTGRTHVVVLVAPGGVGKTTLVKRWLERLKSDGWRGAGCVYGWSFYSQGTSDDRQASDDAFLNDALRWFGVEHDPTLSPWDKGQLLAGAIAQRRTLLVLDGLEPLQYPPGPMGGQLRAPGVQALVLGLARAGQPGLCVVTTREAVGNLAEYRRTGDHTAGGVLAHDLGNLDETDGARLLHRLGVRRAGAAVIGEEEAQLRAASREIRGHALALTLLGSYLKLAHDGDICQRERVRLYEADAEVLGGHAFKVMEGYERWFASAGEQGARALAAVRLLGLFDRPADAACLAALRAEPAIVRLTEPLVGLSEAQWNTTLNRLQECGLMSLAGSPLTPSLSTARGGEGARRAGEGDSGASIDAHPLVREYFAKRLREGQPEAWREGHRRLYEYLKASVPYRPEGLAGLQPLYQAVAHGCKAGLHQEACVAVYRKRILRGSDYDGFYITRRLGAYGADLGGIACFFEEPWKRLAPGLSKAEQAWLLSVVAFNLRALGRLTESLEPTRTSLDICVQQQDWTNAVQDANSLSELELTLGQIAAAERDAERSVAFADKRPRRQGIIEEWLEIIARGLLGGVWLDHGPSDWQRFISTRTTLGDARHQSGRRSDALALFREAEAMQAQRQPEYPLLFSMGGFRYCDLLLGEAERIAWATCLVPRIAATDRPELQLRLDGLREVEQRAAQSLKWADKSAGASLVDIALHRLTLGRVLLYRAILEYSSFEPAGDPLTAAVDGLRDRHDHIPCGLLSRAWLRFMQRNPEGAKADLDEAWQIAERGAMKLHMADILLHRARLFRDRAALEAAARLIEETGYHRRDEELADAREALRSPAE